MTDSNQKSNSLPLQYGQIVNSGSLPSQMFVQYDAGQPMNASQPTQAPAPAAAAAVAQNMNTSRIIGSQMVAPQRAAAQHSQSSFYSQPLAQTGFYQAQQAASSIPVSFCLIFVLA